MKENENNSYEELETIVTKPTELELRMSCISIAQQSFAGFNCTTTQIIERATCLYDFIKATPSPLQ